MEVRQCSRVAPFEEKMEELRRGRKGGEGRRTGGRWGGETGRGRGSSWPNIEHLGVTLLLSIDPVSAFTRPCVSVCG